MALGILKLGLCPGHRWWSQLLLWCWPAPECSSQSDLWSQEGTITLYRVLCSYVRMFGGLGILNAFPRMIFSLYNGFIGAWLHCKLRNTCFWIQDLGILLFVVTDLKSIAYFRTSHLIYIFRKFPRAPHARKNIGNPITWVTIIVSWGLHVSKPESQVETGIEPRSSDLRHRALNWFHNYW